MQKATLVLGSNLGNRRAYLGAALKQIKRWPKTKVLRAGKALETAPEILKSQPVFLNQAIQIGTDLNPIALLLWAKMAEIQLGRTKRVRNGPREIDIDIIDYGRMKIKSPLLTLPHPRKRTSAAIQACLKTLR